MNFDGDAALAAYLQYLSDDDLTALAGASGTNEGPEAIRARPPVLEGLLAAPQAFDALFGDAWSTEPRPSSQQRLVGGAGNETLLRASPFLIFAVMVERCRHDLRGASHVSEWLGPRRRVPVLGPHDLAEFLEDGWRRLFLAQLLGSYTHVASGTVFVPTRRGFRRQRFSELDPVRLAGLLEVVSEAERPGIYRRLGDVALFLTGIFPDHTATSGFSPVAESRLLRAGRLRSSGPSGPLADTGAVGLLEELGQRWYRLAAAGVPSPRSQELEVVGDMSTRFGEARRVLNMMTDRYLWPARDRWFGRPSSS
jgi:hypothetical protein